MSVALALGIGAIVSALAASAANVYAANKNLEAQKEANSANVAMQTQANQSNYNIMQEANAFAASEAQKDRDFQERMSNTQYQRSMADLQAAGINPLMVGSLNGSVPAGSMATPSTTNFSAARVSAEKLDLSGLSSALQSLSTISLINALRK